MTFEAHEGPLPGPTKRKLPKPLMIAGSVALAGAAAAAGFLGIRGAGSGDPQPGGHEGAVPTMPYEPSKTEGPHAITTPTVDTTIPHTTETPTPTVELKSPNIREFGVDVIMAAQVRDLLNKARQEAGLPPLKFNESLTRLAEQDAFTVWDTSPKGTVDDVAALKIEAALTDKSNSPDFAGKIVRSWSVDDYLVSDADQVEINDAVVEAVGEKSLADPKLTEVGIGCIQKPETGVNNRGTKFDYLRDVCVVNLGQPGGFGKNIR